MEENKDKEKLIESIIAKIKPEDIIIDPEKLKEVLKSIDEVMNGKGQEKLGGLSLYRITFPDFEESIEIKPIYILAQSFEMYDAVRIFKEGITDGKRIVSSDLEDLEYLKENEFHIRKIKIESLDGMILTDKEYL